MIKEVQKPPKYWLTPELCKELFEKFRKELEFDEPIPPFENRFPGKLESILGAVQQTFDGKLLNPTILDATTAYFCQLVLGHPFENGNKRMAVLFTHVFLLLHLLDFTLTQKELFSLAIGVVNASQTHPNDVIKQATRNVFSENINRVGKNF